MRIERFLYGMIDGKIIEYKTDGVNRLLHDKSIERLRKLTEEDSDQYLWFPTEQTLAFPRINMVQDKDGREFVQNQTLILNIHDYMKMSNPNQHLEHLLLPVLKDLPETFEPLEVET